MIRQQQFGPIGAASAGIRLNTLAQLARHGSWQLELAHDRPHHLFVWITRGQGIALMDGARRGVGIHKALFLPARSLNAIDLGRQGFAQAITLPPDLALNLPSRPLHLRVRDVTAQGEMTSLLESLQREQNAGRPHSQNAMEAYCRLIAIWMQRHTDMSEEPDTAARRLMRGFFQRLVAPDAGVNVTVARHAEALEVTPTHLSRVCRAETGRTAAALIAERAQHRARMLLSETKVPVQDIARNLGFGSAAYFSRFLQQRTGASPSELRRRARA